MKAVQLQPGFILHQRPYRDSSALLEVFSRDHGRIGLVARGARGPRARQRGLLQPFQPLLFSWGGRGELGSLQEVEANGVLQRLPGAVLYSGFYLNELLLSLLHRHDPHPELYAAYARALEDMPLATERALRLFEKQLLESLGYGLLLHEDALSGAPIDPDGLYRYELESGPVAVSGTLVRGLCLRGSSLLSLAAEELQDADSLAECKRLMRAALGLYLGERALKSREVFAAVMGRS